MTFGEKPRRRWAELSLASQFALAGGVVMLLASIASGIWVSRRIEDTVVRNAANATALYMESFVAPLIQELAVGADLDLKDREALSHLLTDTPLRSRVVSFKIWTEGAKIVASSDQEIIGKVFPNSEDITRAWSGQIVASFNKLDEDENLDEQALGLPLLQIYVPIRAESSGQIIAVAEFYEIGTQLQADLTKARLTSWFGVLVLSVIIGGTLFGIVLRGSRIIDRQMVDLTDMAARNVSLRLKVQGAAARFSQLNDQALRRIGADLHDGPAQLMGFAALRLGSLRRDASAKTLAEIDGIEKAVREAIQEIRNISRGVSLPDIERRDLSEVVQGLVDTHAARTQSEVSLTSTLLPDRDLPIAVKICVGRVVQEGLTNAWRHAAGQGQAVDLREDGDCLIVTVRDSGPGLPDHVAADAEAGYGLGLAGLTGRVESLGGLLTLGRRSDGHQGSELRMVLDLGDVE